jgi:hypothetical protein
VQRVLHVLVAQGVGELHGDVDDVPVDDHGVRPVGEPRSHALGHVRFAETRAHGVGTEEVLLHEFAKGSRRTCPSVPR